jgi:hypothetical protein
MAYVSSTVQSTLSNPPVLMFSAVGIGRGSTALTGNNRQEWFYTSTNLTTDLTAANFFTDGYYLGMRPGDVVIGTQYTAAGGSAVTFQGSIATVTTAGAAFTVSSIMTSTFN